MPNIPTNPLRIIVSIGLLLVASVVQAAPHNGDPFVLEHREDGVIEPAAITPLGVAGDALEVEPQAPDHPKRGVIVGSGCHPYPMHAHRSEAKVDTERRRIGHEATPRGLAPQPRPRSPDG